MSARFTIHGRILADVQLMSRVPSKYCESPLYLSPQSVSLSLKPERKVAKAYRGPGASGSGGGSIYLWMVSIASCLCEATATTRARTAKIPAATRTSRLDRDADFRGASSMSASSKGPSSTALVADFISSVLFESSMSNMGRREDDEGETEGRREEIRYYGATKTRFGRAWGDGAGAGTGSPGARRFSDLI